MKGKQVFYLILGIVALLAAGGMYYVGSNNSRLSELEDFWYMPIPLGILAIALAFKSKKVA